jgi:hypothetical protein
MNVQPPIQHKFFALPGTTQRDANVDTTGRKPSLAMASRPSAMRGHLVAVRTHVPSRCLLSMFSLLTFDPVHRRVPRHLHVPLLRLCCSQRRSPGLQGLWFRPPAEYLSTLVHLAFVRIQSRSQRLGLLPHQRWPFQSSCDARPHAHRLPDLAPRRCGAYRADPGCHRGGSCRERSVSLRKSSSPTARKDEQAC